MRIFDHDRLGVAVGPGWIARRHDGTVHEAVLVLSDDALPDSPEELRGRLCAILEAGPSRLVVDLSRVSRLSSTTIATLLWVKRTCGSRAVEVVVHPPRHSVGVLHRTGLLASGVPDPQAWTRWGVGTGATAATHERGRP